MNANDELGRMLIASLTNEPQRWKTFDYGKPYYVFDSCKRDDGVEVMVDDPGGYVRIQGLGEYSTVIRVYGDVESAMKRAMHQLHLNRNEQRSARALQQLRERQVNENS